MKLFLCGALVFAAGCASAPEWPGPSRPYQNKVRVIPGTVETEDFDEGGEGVAYHDLEPENKETKRPLYRESGVDLEVREDASQKFNLGWTRPGEWLVYTVDVKETGTYTIEMMVACDKRGGLFRLEFNGVDKTGPVEVPDTGGWKNLKPFSKAGVKLESGRYAMKLVLDKGGERGSIGDIDYFRFVKQ
jgi:hypothetical protein